MIRSIRLGRLIGIAVVAAVLIAGVSYDDGKTRIGCDTAAVGR